MSTELEREALVVVKAYPNPSAKYHETVCVAALTAEEGWIRLHPVQFRSLPEEQRFQKYQLVRLRMRKHERDHRPESYRPNQDSIQLLNVLDPQRNLSDRWSWLRPNIAKSMCDLRELQRSNGTSLGCIKPRVVEDLLIEESDATWSKRKEQSLGQLMLFDSVEAKLEKIPYVFRYKYRCANVDCPGHEQCIIDWELMQLYRRLRDSHSDRSVVLQEIRKKYLTQMCDKSKDTHFIVGNHSRFPASFMVLGVFWPPKDLQLPLF